ncbi:MAG: EamA family transporter RarD [Gemmata sp.]
MGEEAARFRSGLAFGLIAYLWWGLVPLYFAALAQAGVPAWEILAHRIVWSLHVMLLLLTALRGWGDVLRVLRARKLVLTLLLSSTFLALNWLVYIYATVTGRVVEASLGYYMMPLVNAALAPIFLGERLRPAQFPALALVAVGVAIPFVWKGNFTWIAVALPITFGLYGLVRKKAAVESMTGLTVETLLMLPPSLGFLLCLTALGRNHMSPTDWGLNGLIAFSGVVTVVPLLTYTLSLRRLPLLAVSFIQFLSPTVQMLIAVLWLGESLTLDRGAALACVWSAVVIFICDALYQARQSRRASRGPQPSESAQACGSRLTLPTR